MLRTISSVPPAMRIPGIVIDQVAPRVGRIVEQEEIFERPQHAYTAEFLAASPDPFGAEA